MGNINSDVQKYVSPINSIEEAIFILSLKLCFSTDTEIIKDLNFSAFGILYNCETINGAISKYLFFMKDLKLKISTAKQLIENSIKTVKDISECVRCSKSMEIIDKKSIVTYSYEEVSTKNFVFRECKQCSILYSPDYYKRKNEKLFYSHKINNNLDYFFTSKDTAFAIKLLKWYDFNLVRNCTSLSGFTDAYNCFMQDQCPLNTMVKIC
jgi:hypothetical protein